MRMNNFKNLRNFQEGRLPGYLSQTTSSMGSLGIAISRPSFIRRNSWGAFALLTFIPRVIRQAVSEPDLQQLFHSFEETESCSFPLQLGSAIGNGHGHVGKKVFRLVGRAVVESQEFHFWSSGTLKCQTEGSSRKPFLGQVPGQMFGVP